MALTPYYTEVLQELRVSTQLEKFASQGEEGSVRAMLKQAELAHVLVTRMIKISSHSVADATLHGKDAVAANLVKFAMDLRESHEAIGTKLAASPEQVVDGLKKLATATYLDQFLGEQLDKTAQGPDYEETLSQRSLGREYIVDLMRGLLQ